MSRPLSRLLRGLGVVLVAASLSACISLFPKSKPSQLYRFDAGQAPAAAPRTASASRVLVLRSGGTFNRAAAGDRLLTVTNDQVAYVAQARWASPAVTLWDEAVSQAFDANPGPAHLVVRGEPLRTDYVLRLDVRNFEAVYERGPEAAPTVVVRVQGSLVRSRDRQPVLDQAFEARVPAADNRVGAIVSAYDKAVGQVLGEVVAWTNTLPPVS